MSIWDDIKKFAQPYSDDEYDEYDEDEEDTESYEETPAAEPEPRPARTRRTPAFGSSSGEERQPAKAAAPVSATGSTGFSGQVVNMSNKQEVVLFHPANFNDTSKAADDLRSRKAVIVNMENVDKAMARRVVDFLSGCAYALDGKVKKVAQSTYLFCPYNMEVIGDLENLQSEVESYL
ncbi:MAG: cell division protein SepF [Firmicutes bacterium]|nr:cell division protein SepF [Bacillota bacterium]